ncbi:class I SAM-dependent methyltransferase [Amycolatopsis nigrescens]|uniref:class I SAM-dependent methyltransferase n=1 Tax=Amycolatopsis nigrescens TaxID=381445 RepID=UPI0003780126|nr:class I SAM-dependent methyltransferase [Amycolatopsis nigrescens]
MTHGIELDRLRELLDPGRAPEIPEVPAEAGYLDLLPPEQSRPRTPAQAAMHNPLVAAVYERWWRPLGGLLMGLHGPRMAEERGNAARMLGLTGEQLVLDVACGPGNFTRGFGEALSGKGFAVGLDVSPPMLARAVRDNRGDRVAYLRADARTLPFPDLTFDAVGCFAALYLVPQPFVVLDELIRVLAPGGRVAVLTSCRTGVPGLRGPETLIARTAGLRLFERHDITRVFERHGLRDIDQKVTGFAQFVTARK